jgi:hypothetical protein
MTNKISIAAAAVAIVTALAAPSIASAQAAMFLPSTYSWNQVQPTGIPADAHDSVTGPAHHRAVHGVKPYGQW